MWEGVRDIEKRDEDVAMEDVKGTKGEKMEVDGKDSVDSKDKDGR